MTSVGAGGPRDVAITFIINSTYLKTKDEYYHSSPAVGEITTH